MIDKNKLIAQIQRFYKDEEYFMLLESQMKNHPASKNTYLAAGSEISIKAFGNEIHIIEQDGEKIFKQDPWQALKEFRSKYDDWCFGFLGYDLKNFTERLSSKNKVLIKSPDLFFFVPEVVLEINDKNEVNSLKGQVPKDLPRTVIESEIILTLDNQIPKKEYLEKIIKAQNHIQEGDYYEINVSHPLEFTFKGKGWDLYQRMKEIGPVPFGSFIKIDNLEICSASPERFLSKRGKKISSQPIKGTISRSEGDDESRIKALSNSEKERAENLMIVDLVRNDMSRVAKEGSVKVSNLFEIQSFETVHQMVSTVEGDTKEGVDSIDILKACFPMGSMTGAPKVASMKSIEELEDYKRGVYSGAIGYFTPDDDFDFSVVIRTAIIEGEYLVYPVGGAITSDSDPELEWEETLIKAHAITKVIN
jgi:para-aminobenzoate synthetase component 1